MTISSFAVSPTTTADPASAADTTAAGNPFLQVAATFGSSDGTDTAQNVTISLAPGLLANPSAVTPCTTANFTANNCPASSQIAQGTVTGFAPQFGATLALPTYLYLVTPPSGALAEYGLIVNFFDYPIETLSGPVNIRQTPNFGVDIPITGLPQTVEGTQIVVKGLNLTINATMNAQPFTRNPTSCSGPATTVMSLTSWEVPATPVNSSSSFTPTNCSALAYTPKINGTAAMDSAGDIATTITITQTYAEADNQSINMIMPLSLSPRLSALAAACTSANVSSCPSIGTATVTTPLLATPISANVVLSQLTAGTLPTIDIVIPPPFNITLIATPILTGASVQALVTNIPDIPISGLVLSLPGGANSLFRAGTHFCTQAQSFGGNFTAWSGATANPTTAATITGCPAVSPAARASVPSTASLPAPGLAGAQGASSNTAGKAAAGLVTLTDVAGSAAKMTFAAGAAKAAGGLKSVTLSLPKGLSVRTAQLASHLKVMLDGHLVKCTASFKDGKLTITFSRKGNVAIVSLSSPALTVSKSSAAKQKQMTVVLTVRSTNGHVSTYHLVTSAR
jgi:hypothetical protein